MKDYLYLIESSDVLDILDGKTTTSELKQEKLNLLNRFCKTDEERAKALLDVENLFTIFSPFALSLTNEECNALRRYGARYGSNSFEINQALRLKLPLSEVNQRMIECLDGAISKFHLPEDITVYRALSGSDIEFSDEGYMSTSLSLPESYAVFEGYDNILEINLPAGSSCVYLEWFKGIAEEGEMLLARGTSLNLESARTEEVFGTPKRIYSCTAVQKEHESVSVIH